jgi:hypothetical protein
MAKSQNDPKKQTPWFQMAVPGPKKMPDYFFHGAWHVDYSTAVRANVENQNYSIWPRHWYIDAMFTCADCKKDFLFSADEQRFWYEGRRFYVDSRPVRCANCRKKERIRRREAQLPKAQRTIR